MELYVLDSLLRRSAVVDRFESMIWTERYSAWGDFELLIYSTQSNRTLFTPGIRLAMSDSYRVMTAEFIENATDEEGRHLLKVKGRSLESVLDERVARNTFADLTTTPKWILSGTPGDIAREIFDDICRTNVNFPDDELPYLMAGALFPLATIAEPDVIIQVELSLTSVYAAIKSICDAYNIGFRIVRNFDKSELYFDIYTGFDRTTLQSAVAPVVFSPELDNLSKITELTSISNYKNVAYVFHPIGVQIVTADGVATTIDGFARRIMHVDASDIEVPERSYSLTTAQKSAIDAGKALTVISAVEKLALENLANKKRLTAEQVTATGTVGTGVLTAPQKAEITGAKDVSVAYNTTENAYMNPILIQRGKDELSKNRSLQAFDGELPSNSLYKYNFAYNLGDLVEVRNSDGVTNQMRVTEQIFVSDSEGERSYPTLTIDLFITPGSWFAWNYSQVWADADGVWEEA